MEHCPRVLFFIYCSHTTTTDIHWFQCAWQFVALLWIVAAAAAAGFVFSRVSSLSRSIFIFISHHSLSLSNTSSWIPSQQTHGYLLCIWIWFFFVLLGRFRSKTPDKRVWKLIYYYYLRLNVISSYTLCVSLSLSHLFHILFLTHTLPISNVSFYLFRSNRLDSPSRLVST